MLGDPVAGAQRGARIQQRGAIPKMEGGQVTGPAGDSRFSSESHKGHFRVLAEEGQV